MKHNISNQILEEAVKAMDNVFDSHDLIVEIMKRWPREYVLDLCEQSSTEDPILQAHATIATRLHDIPSIKPTKKVKSMNVRRQKTECQQWKKI